MAKVNLKEPQPIVLNSWKGLYSRGMADAVPPGYFSDCLNVQYNQKDVRTRDGFTLDYTQANIVRFAIYNRINEASRYLILDNTGSLFDSLYPASYLIRNSSYVDFSMVVILNRAYIIFHNRITGLSSSSIYVYQGAGPGTLRLAAGTAPSAFTLGVATSVSSGNVEVGTHLFAVAFETDSGFITAPGPAVFTQYDAPGDFKVDISAIPVGPYGTSARWILATHSIDPDLYDGNQLSLELFFAHRIGNNIDTTYAGLSFFDADLIDSADYLLDNRSTIPAGVFISSYGNRMITGGVNGNERVLYVSKDGEPEVFDTTNGTIEITSDASSLGLQNGIEFRGSFYFGDSDQFRLVIDNGNDPNTWTVSDVDTAVGTFPFGISKVLDSKANTTSRFFVATEGGLLVFEAGIFQRPEVSWNIQDTWARINKSAFNRVQVVHNPENSTVYISVPLDNSSTITHILVAYYGNALQPPGFIIPSEVRWAIWDSVGAPQSIVTAHNSTNQLVLKVSGSNGIYRQVPNSRFDVAGLITSFIKTYYMFMLPAWIHQFTQAQFRVNGSGELNLVLYGEDDVKTTSLANTITLSSASGKEYFRFMNFVNEKMAMRIGITATAGSWFQLNQVVIEGKPLWASRFE